MLKWFNSCEDGLCEIVIYLLLAAGPQNDVEDDPGGGCWCWGRTSAVMPSPPTTQILTFS